MPVEISAERLRELLRYDPVSGLFYWRVDRRRARVGDIAGNVTRKGYISIKVDQGVYLAHRLAWLYVHGEWPNGGLDHRDTHRDHNWIDNLRLATVSQNGANQRLSSRNTSGFKGVTYFARTGRWQAAVKKDGRKVWTGYFSTPEEAHAAYAAAAAIHFGQFANDGT